MVARCAFQRLTGHGGVPRRRKKKDKGRKGRVDEGRFGNLRTNAPRMAVWPGANLIEAAEQNCLRRMAGAEQRQTGDAVTCMHAGRC